MESTHSNSFNMRTLSSGRPFRLYSLSLPYRLIFLPFPSLSFCLYFNVYLYLSTPLLVSHPVCLYFLVYFYISTPLPVSQTVCLYSNVSLFLISFFLSLLEYFETFKIQLCSCCVRVAHIACVSVTQPEVCLNSRDFENRRHNERGRKRLM